MAKPASKARRGRRALYVSALVALGVLSPFALGLGLLLRGQAARSFDSKDSWRGIWAFALLGGWRMGSYPGGFTRFRSCLWHSWGRCFAGTWPRECGRFSCSGAITRCLRQCTRWFWRRW